MTSSTRPSQSNRGRISKGRCSGRTTRCKPIAGVEQDAAQTPAAASATPAPSNSAISSNPTAPLPPNQQTSEVCREKGDRAAQVAQVLTLRQSSHILESRARSAVFSMPTPCRANGLSNNMRESWCGWGESNSHALRRRILNPLRLPFRHTRTMYTNMLISLLCDALQQGEYLLSRSFSRKRA